MSDPNPATDALLAAIDADAPAMEARLLEWAAVNSGSDNAAGLRHMAGLVAAAFRELGPHVQIELVPLPEEVAKTPAAAVRARVRPNAPVQVLFSGHMDTVYGPKHPFQWCTQIDDDTLGGPGVADMKGGLVVMLAALRAFEKHPAASGLGWEAFIVPDEETGSEASSRLLQAMAERHQHAIVFEPSLADGSLVGSRKGGGVIRATAHGRSAHSGRDFAAGRNAIVALARFVGAANSLNTLIPDVVVNAGSISGGGAVNIVPDHAVADFNIRARREADGEELLRRLFDSAEAIGQALECRIELEGGFIRPPMDETPVSRPLLEAWRATAHDLGIELGIGHAGGGSDGNFLAAAGLPVIDGVGVEGGDLHSEREWVRLSSLARRAKIAALFLARLASGEIAVPAKQTGR